MTNETVVLKAAAYRLVCPECGRVHFVTRHRASIQCKCGATVTVGMPKHNFGNGNVPAGVPIVASYRWTCRDCLAIHYESQAVPTVQCSRCGATFEVDAVEHEPQT